MLKPICKSVICHISAFLPITSTKEEQKEYKKGKPFEAQCRKIPPYSFTLQKAADIPPSFSVQCSALPCLCNTGKKHTPYRYSGLRPPASSTICFWAFCRNLSDGMPPHYSSKQRRSIIQTKILSQLDFLLY